MHRLVLSCFVLSSLVACIPRTPDPMTSDFDRDGIVDALDACMGDAEDIDDREDEDGCPEPGEGTSVAAQDGETSIPVAADPTTKKRTVKRKDAKVLKQTQARAEVTPYRKLAWGAAIDDSERGWLVFGFGKAWLGSGASKGKELRGDIYRAVFSKDGKSVGMVGANHLLIAEVQSGKLIKRFAFAKGTEDSPESKLVRMQGNSDVIYYDGCRLFKSTLAKNSKPTPISAELCGRPLASDDGRHWFVYQQNETAATVYKLDLGGGAPSVVLGGTSDEAGLSQLLLSPSGKHLCFSRNKDGSAFTCRDNAGADEIVVWEGPTDSRASFAENGTLAFGAGRLRAERDLMLVDLEALRLRKLGTLGAKEEWLAAVGDTGFVASGGQRLVLFDVDAGQQITVPLDKGEWEGFSAIPGRDREFILGKERKASRDLFRVKVGNPASPDS